MEIPKPSEDDKQFFRSLIAEDPEVEIKPMFGNLGAFVHGNMFAGLFGSAVGVKRAEPDAAELAAGEGAGPFGPAERPMGGYLGLPGAWREAMRRLLGVEVDYTQVADALNPGHSSYFESTEDYDMLIFEGLGPKDEPFPLETRTAAFFVFERLLITVFVNEHSPQRPEEIVLHCPPLPFRP